MTHLVQSESHFWPSSHSGPIIPLSVIRGRGAEGGRGSELQWPREVTVTRRPCNVRPPPACSARRGVSHRDLTQRPVAWFTGRPGAVTRRPKIADSGLEMQGLVSAWPRMIQFRNGKGSRAMLYLENGSGVSCFGMGAWYVVT